MLRLPKVTGAPGQAIRTMVSWQDSYFTVQSCAGNFAEALQVYLEAAAYQAQDKTEAAKLHSNISATLAELGEYSQAVEAANQVVKLQPSWEKGYLRKIQALISLQLYTEAIQTSEQGLQRAQSIAGLSEAQQVLADLLQRTRKKGKLKQTVAEQPTSSLQNMAEQPASSLQTALCKLQTAGSCKSAPSNPVDLC